jgi:hypothetical protein
MAETMKKRRKASLAKWRGRQGMGRIVSDPDKEGGFQPGAEIGFVTFMLEAGSFTVGTVLAYRGRQWRVHMEDGQQRLVLVRR